MKLELILQLPPTPTPLPPATPKFDMGDSFSMWRGTDTMIHIWNWFGSDGQAIIQAMILILFVVIGLFLLVKFIQQFTRRDAEI